MRHLAEHAEPGRRAAGDDRGLAQEFTAGDEAGIELLGEVTETMIHGSGSFVGVAWW